MFKEVPPRLLAVGPLPPPFSGTTVSFQIFCNVVNRHQAQLQIEVVNSAPKHLGQYPLFTRAHFETAQRIVRQFIEKIRHVDQVLIFGQDQFFFSVAAVCLNIAKVAGKPCYFRSIGGSLDNYYMGLRPILRNFFHSTLKRVDGLILETELNQQFFTQLIGSKVHYVPGYRPFCEAGMNERSQREKMPTGRLRTAFVSHIREEKGIFVLLESLRNLARDSNESFECDFFGPIYGAASQRFQQELVQTPNATYKGLLDPEDVVPTLRNYDVLILPTHYSGEGHPGVVIEAMMAGIPVVTTRHRSIPEIIHDGENGLLIEPHNVRQLEEALQNLATNRPLLTTMGENNWLLRTQFSAACQVPRILHPLGIQL